MTKKGVIYTFSFTLLALFFRGYSYGLGDQVIHIPLIKKIVNPSLYPNDLLFLAHQSKFSLFYPLIAIIVKNIPLSLETVFFAGYFSSLILFFLFLYQISNKIFKADLWASLLLGLFFLLPFPIGGSAIFSVDVGLVPRWLAFVVSLACLYWLISNRFLIFSLITPFIFAIHPLTFLHFLFIVIAYRALGKVRMNVRYVIIFVLAFILVNFSIVINILLFQIQNVFFSLANTHWQTVLRERNHYAFFDLWPFKAWLSLALIILPNIIYLLVKRNKKDDLYWLLSAVFFAAIFASLVQLIFTIVFPSPFVIKLQLSRLWIFAYLTGSLAIINLTIQQSMIKLPYLVILGLIILFLLSKSWASGYKKQNKHWIDVQNWAKVHTSRSCTFLTPLFFSGFRVYSERSVVSEYKDGTLSFYSPVFAREWSKRRYELENWEDFDFDQLSRLQQKYRFSFLVSNRKLPIANDPIYQNAAFRVYQMPNLERGCEVKPHL